MRKIIFLIVLFPFMTRAQYKYKIELYSNFPNNQYLAQLKVQNNTNTLFATINFTPSINGKSDFISKLNQPISTYYLAFDTVISQFACDYFQTNIIPLGCVTSIQPILGLPNDQIDCGLIIYGLNIREIKSLSSLNNYSFTNVNIKECETKNFNYSDFCYDAMSLAVEYQIGNSTTWIEKINYLPVNLGSLDLAITDFPGLTVGMPLRLRVRYVPTATNPDDYSDILTYYFIKCSPQLLNFSSTNTTCSYSQDGTFKMKLDRNLNANEQLVVTLYKESVTGSGNYDQLLGQKDTTTLINNGDGTFSYQWPDPVASGSYKVKYQTITVGATIQGWASLEFSPGFVVSNPPPVVFSGTKANNVYCKDGADGAINLNASGGVGNYKYEINNSGVWVPFANPNTHTINGLPKGTLTLKVQDGNGCTEKL